VSGWLLGIATVLALGALTVWLVLAAVRRAVRRDEVRLPAPAPCPPAGAPLAGPARARYLGTTWSPSSVQRVAAHGLLGRAVVVLRVDRQGLRVDRGPAGPWCVPRADLRGARATSHHAGKRAAAGSVLVVDWVLGGRGLRSGFVLDREQLPHWVAAVQAVVPA
jgi:hypothetical protein